MGMSHEYATRLKKLDYAIAFKMAVTALLSFYAGESLSKISGRPDLLNNLWCVLTALVVIKPNLGGTYEAALYRFLGILIGSILGGFFAQFFGSNGMTLSIAVFFTAIACLLIKIKDSIRISALSVCVIMVLHHLYPEHDPWIFSFYRFLDSTLGIIIAMFVSHILFPKMAEEDIYLNLAKVLSCLNKLFDLSLESDEHTEMRKVASSEIRVEVDKLLIDARNYFNQSKMEIFGKDDGPQEWSLILDSIDRIYESILSIHKAHHYELTKIFDDALSKKIEEYRDQTSVAFGSLVRQLEDKFLNNLPYPYVDEGNALAALNEELLRFRNTRSTRRYDLQDVENFYVFFYSLRSIGEELQRIETHLSNAS